MTLLGKLVGLGVWWAWAAGALAAGSGTVNVGITVVGSCRFNSAPTLAFGTLSPEVAATATATVGVSFDCTVGSAYTLTADNGAYYDSGSGLRRMKRSGSNAYIPYDLTPLPTSGTTTTTTTTVTLTGSILYNNFRNANPGSYSDSVTLTIAP